MRTDLCVRKLVSTDDDSPRAFARIFAHFANGVAHTSGKPLTFALSVVVVIVWAALGPMFHYSDTWQLVINTGTTIVTFLMVFLIQSTQNRDGAAIQAKLDELIRASAAQNRYIGIEQLTEEELNELRDRCATRAKAGRLDNAFEAADQAAHRANKIARSASDKVIGVD
jgi:low affinity Fe/Cu permease